MKYIYSFIENRLLAITKSPYKSLGIATLIILSMSMGLSNLKMETDYNIFFSPNDEMVQQFERFQKEYGREDSVYLMVDTKKSNGVFTDESLLLIFEMEKEIKSWQYIERVNSLINYPLVTNIDGGLSIGTGLSYHEGNIQHERPIQSLINSIGKDDSAVGRIISKSGDKTGIWVSLHLDSKYREDSSEHVYRSANGYLKRLRKNYPEFGFYMTGSVALDEAFAEANQKDLMTLFPAAFIAMILLAGILSKSFLIMITSLICGIGSVLISLGFSGHAGIPLSSVSVSSPTIVMILTIAQIVHLFIAYGNEQGDLGIEVRISNSIKRILLPSILSTLTTFTGLIMLTVSPIPPFKHLGIIAGMGILISWPLPILIGSVLLRFRNPATQSRPLIQGIINKIAISFRTGNLEKTGFSLLLISLVMSCGIVMNKLDDNYVTYFDESFSFRTDTDKIANGLSGIYFLEYDLVSKSGDIHTVEYIQSLHDLRNYIMGLNGVVTVDSFDGPISKVEASLNETATSQLIPTNRNAVERNRVLYEMAVPSDYDLRNRIADDQGSTRLTVYLSNISINEITTTDIDIQKFMNKHHYWMHNSTKATGVSVLFSVLGKNNIQAMLIGTFILFSAVSILMLVIFRDWRIGLVASLGNIIPATLTLGIWGFFVGEIGLASAAVATVTLGIVVDDTMHLAYRYKSELIDGKTPHAAMEIAIEKVGSALGTSTIILGLGFVCLAFSGFTVNASLGLMVAMTVLIAGVFDLICLPVCMLRLSQKNNQFPNQTS